MPADLSELDSEFAGKVFEVISRLDARDIKLVPYCAIRDPWTQARYWRQSRTSSQVEQALAHLKDQKAMFLHQVLESVGPQMMSGWKTSALPGQSWHQWGEAVDCYVEGENGLPEWDANHPGYQAYAEEAKREGLTAGFYWPMRDAVHIQLEKGSPADVCEWKEIDREMAVRFGG